ncbi:MAG TPA: hypothetical protein VFQ53_00260 [Kofleriaceae bacterium]|nr:hypothetical protein [Kofleriaceae bacterium]
MRVRPVRGRLIDPYRGSLALDEAQPERFEPRTPEPQPLDEVVATLRRIANTKLVSQGRRFKLTRDRDILVIGFATAAKRVSVDDASLDGDPLLAIETLHALLPLFGPVEVRCGTFVDLIDGHEPVEPIAQRYRAYWIEETLKLAERLRAVMPAAPSPSATPISPLSSQQRSTQRKAALQVLGVLVLIIGGLVTWSYVRDRGASTGAVCTRNKDCASDECLPQEPVRQVTYNGIPLDSFSKPAIVDPTGVCTKSCGVDSDCPAAMRCETVLRYSTGYGLTTHTTTTRCVPRAWLTPSLTDPPPATSGLPDLSGF